MCFDRIMQDATDTLGPPYTKDAISGPRMLRHMVLAGGTAALITVVAWFVLGQTNLPAYSTSFVTKALTSAGVALVVFTCAIAVYFWLHPWGAQLSWQRWGLGAIMHLAPAGVVIASLGMPLSATRLYLDGVSVDQAFRTQFLTRMTDTPGWVDMSYLDMPSFYPGLWFFTGGLFAKTFGMAGWAAYQPWALITLAAAFSMLVPVWRRITGSLAVGCAVAMVSTIVTLHVAPEEPYAAIVAIGIPPALVLARRALHGARFAMIGLIIYLGLSANLYTLFTAVTAVSIIVLALAHAIHQRILKPIWRLLVIGLGSIAIALIGWGPYLFALLTRPHGPTGKAQHYLPNEGTQFPMPFFDSTALGLLALIGLIWLVVRALDGDIRALIAGLLTSYAWVGASMIATLFGTTLLGFRLALPLALLFAVSGVLGIAELRLTGLQWLYPASVKPQYATVITRIFVVLLAAGSVYYAVDVPTKHQPKIDLAYTDADGDAVRGDRMPADATTYYKDVDAYLLDHLGQRAGSVVLTDEKSFMSFYPYNGYQALTAHYANPLGEFERRNAEIESWTDFTDPDQLAYAMDKAEHDNGWEAPNALVMRGSVPTTPEEAENAEFSYMLADDIYPNQPNVRFRTVQFSAKAFMKHWDLKQIGPFAVAVRK